MKILAVHNAYNDDQGKRPAVDQWRIARPLAELKKHVNWQIDERPTIIPNLNKYKDASQFSEEEMEAAFKDICEYDIVFSSYHANPTMYTLLKVAADRAGVQYVMDIDDDMFAINPDNPVWLKLNDSQVYSMQRMIADNTWITTTTETLAKVFRSRRKGHSSKSVTVLPNYIHDAYKHPAFDNGDKLVIGFFGGSSHYADLHETGVLEAIERIMHEHKNVHFKSVGMVIEKYLPKARMTVEDPKKGDGWINELFPTLNMDIALGPLVDNIFNRGKSNIKWQESTRAGAMFIASNIGPYSKLPPDTALLCRNTPEDWYRVIKQAVTDEAKRKSVLSEAQRVLESRYRLEDNWQQYKELFDTVYKQKELNHANRKSSKEPAIL